MYYEDMPIGEATDLGSTTFSRESILAYGARFDPRVLAGAQSGEPLKASGLHVASVAMRRLVEARNALRAFLAARGEILPEFGVSPGFRDMRWPHPVFEGDVISYSRETVSKRETSKPKWGLVGSLLRGVNQRGEVTLLFSGLVLALRRSEEK